MRTGKELIQESKQYTSENRRRSWLELIITLLPIPLFLLFIFWAQTPILVKPFLSACCGLLYVRLFVIYHDYQHRAILQNSLLANGIMKMIGLFLLAPETIWKRSHEHHHNNNSKLTIAGIGSYPTISKNRFLSLTKKERQLYLLNRHPLTVIFGYVTLFIYWLNIKSVLQSPKRHLDSLLALLLHGGGVIAVLYYFGVFSFLLAWFIPFFMAFGIGSYLFYCQHNFPKAQFRENHEWKYDHAALASTSYMVMNPVMQWFTGNIGLHHVHHLNSRIPFYRLKEVANDMPELKDVSTTSWDLLEVIRCFRLKLWDAEKGKMITLREL